MCVDDVLWMFVGGVVAFTVHCIALYCIESNHGVLIRCIVVMIV